MSNRILLIEDEENIRKLVKLNLEMESYEVDVAKNGTEALDKIFSAHYDLLILDLMLPEIQGMDVLKKMRLSYPDLPVIITSAKDTSADRIEGLRAGADDYLNKPFHIEELIIRIQKLISRNREETSEITDVYTFGLDNEINFKEYLAQSPIGRIKLTKKEVLLLKLLITNEQKAVTREEMFKNIWGYDVYPSSRTIDNFILNFRKHFELDPKSPKHFISIRGVGYKFMP